MVTKKNKTQKDKTGTTDKPAAPKNPKSRPAPKSKPAPKSQQAQKSHPSQEAHTTGFPIVGIGASAGGLEAFEQFFRSVPPGSSGMAFVLVSHLDPSHASILTEILQRTTAMPVAEAQDQMAVAPNGVYVIPPNRDMAIFHGVLQLSVPEQPRGQRMPIDAFLRSLADDQGENAIGVILSGTGTDGTLGLRAILGAGGVTLVQEPATAKYDGMPASAINAGYATHVLPVEKMPEVLLAGMHTLSVRQETPPAPAAVSGLNRILMLLRTGTGHDFSLYKKSTIGRRIERRMSQHNIEDTEVYARYLKEHPAEVKALFKELLINVTSFFRDAEAFVTLKRVILPLLFEGKPEDYIFRVWVAGCASGEEAYSIAILLREFMDETRQEFKIQLYSTDLDEDAIAVARAGIYPPNIAQDVAPERLRRFFIKEEAGYRVKKDIREMVVFAAQNVIKDPPFTKLDLLSCRNLMIYLEQELQNRLIPAFHYALKPGGVLFLSPSESIGNHPELFAPLNRKWKFYRATGTIDSTRAVMSGGLLWTKAPNTKGPDEVTKKIKETNFAELTRRMLLQSYAPASVVTDLKGNILFVHGDTGKYLRPAPGQATLNVVDMAREGLQLELRAALNSASQGAPILRREVSVKTNGDFQAVNLNVRPLPDPDASEKLLLVSFQDVAHPAPGKPGRGKGVAPGQGELRRVEELERELAYSRENLQATIEEQQASNEELKSTNEELQSTNEELQSTNEELETSKEELQSVNEELITVNAELQTKIEQLTGMQNDMKNLLDNINIGTIFLDEHLNIKRFTREAAQVYRLVASDIGRPLGDIKSDIEGEDLLAKAQAVLNTLVPCEREVRTVGGAWYLARIQPYRTLENVIEGVVLTFIDITEMKRASEEHRLQSTALSATANAVIITDRNGIIQFVNPAFTAISGYSAEEALGQSPRLLKSGKQDQAFYKRLWDTILAGRVWQSEVVNQRKNGSRFHATQVITPVQDESGEITHFVAIEMDITERKQAEAALREAHALAEGIIDTVREPLIMLDGKLKIVSASRSFYRNFQTTPEDTVGRSLYDLGNRQWDIPKLRELLENILPRDQSFEGYAVEHDFPGIGQRKMLLNARRIVGSTGDTQMILLAMEFA